MSIVTVGTSAALAGALSSAQSGDTVLLQAGTYAGLNLANLNFGTGVTIASADAAHQAVLTNFDMTNVTGLTFHDLTFNVTVPSYAGFNVYSSHNITLDQVSVHGSLDNDSSNDAEGFRFFDSDHVTISGSTFQQLAKAAQFANTSAIVLAGNDVHDVMSSGFVFAQVDHVSISGNIIHDLKPVDGHHPDAIQFTTANTTIASHDIDISGNLIYRGAGDYTQGIFMRDEVGNLPFQTVTIADNTIVGTGWSAIRPTHNIGLTISGNTLVSLAGDNDTRATIENSDQVVVTNNHAIVGDGIGFDTLTTHLTNTGNTTNQAVSDGGSAAVQQWLAANETSSATAIENAMAPTAHPVAPASTGPLEAFVIDLGDLQSIHFQFAWFAL